MSGEGARSPTGGRRLVVAGVVLGAGLGGFFDGIVFHQVLQTHHMLSGHPDPAVASDLRLNVLADGVFHVATYVATALGIGLVWRVDRSEVAGSDRVLLGSILVGWGLFNVLEGAVNHHLLGLHHVWPAGPGGRLVWDLAFLAWGIVFLVVGGALLTRQRARTG